MPRKVEAFDMMDEGEESYFLADFSRELAEGETISTVDSVVFDPPDELEALDTPAIVEDGTAVRVKLGSGVAGTKYFVKFTVTTSNGQVLPRTSSVKIGESTRPLT